MHEESQQHQIDPTLGIDEDPRIVEFHRARRVLYDNLRNRLQDNWELVELFMQRLHYLIEIIGTRTDDWLNIKQRLALYLPPVLAVKRLLTRKRTDLKYFHNDTELAIIAYWASITGVRPFIKPEKFCYEDTPKKKRHYIVFERNAAASAALLERKRLEAEQAASSVKKTRKRRRRNDSMATTKTNNKARRETPKLSTVLSLNEQDDGYYDSPGFEGGYGVSLGGGGGSGASSGSNSMWARNGLFGAMGFAAIRDIWNILKRDAAKLGVQALATVGSLFAGTITILIPLNSHLATSYVTRKFMYWEMKAIKSINRQFEKELAGFDTGWELIKPDLIGLGFFIAPYGVVGNMMAAGQAIDTAISITNVMTGGMVGYLIDRILQIPEDMRDPGNLDYYIRSHLYRPFSYSSNNWKERGLLGNLFHLSNDELHSPHLRSRLMEAKANSGALQKNLKKLKDILGDGYQEDMRKFMEEFMRGSKEAEAAFVKRNTTAYLAPMFPAIKSDLQKNAPQLGITAPDVANWSSRLSSQKGAVLDSIMKRYQPLIAKDSAGASAADNFKQIMLAAMA